MGLGSGIRKKPIPDPGSGSRGQKGTGSGIRCRNTDLKTRCYSHSGYILRVKIQKGPFACVQSTIMKIEAKPALSLTAALVWPSLYSIYRYSQVGILG